MPRKAREGRLDEIRQCVGANEGCIDRIYQGKPVTCIQNPGRRARGSELGGDLVPAATRKRGRRGRAAGSAGSRRRASRRCAATSVVLFEKERELRRSGARSPRALPRGRTTRGSCGSWSRQVERQGVDVPAVRRRPTVGRRVLAERARRRGRRDGLARARARAAGARRQARRHGPRRAPRAAPRSGSAWSSWTTSTPSRACRPPTILLEQGRRVEVISAALLRGPGRRHHVHRAALHPPVREGRGLHAPHASWSPSRAPPSSSPTSTPARSAASRAWTPSCCRWARARPDATLPGAPGPRPRAPRGR